MPPDAAVIGAVLPPGIAFAAAVPGTPVADLLDEEAADLGSAVPARQAEFRAGRHCAREVLRTLRVPVVPIRCGRDREPVWPAAVVGSITHCPGYCAAAGGARDRFAAVGIDAEPHQALPRDVAADVLLPGEAAWIARAPAGIHWDRVVFSAKESVYKACWPLTGRWLGFGDAAIAIDPPNRRFEAALIAGPVSVAGRRIRTLAGWFTVSGGLIATSVVVVRHR